MPARAKTARIRRMPSIRNVRRKQVNRMHSVMQSNSLFDHGYWFNLYYRGNNQSKYSQFIFAQRSKNILRFKGNRLQKYIKSDIKRIAKSRDFKLLRTVLSYWVGMKGMVDAPIKALAETDLKDWAAAVEEGRGITTNWGTVANLYFEAKAEYHLRRLKMEMPKRARLDGIWNKRSIKDLVKRIDVYRRVIAEEKKAAKKVK